MQLPHLLRKIRVLEDAKLQLRAGCYCVLRTDLTSIPILYSLLRFQLKIKSFQALFFFSHSSPELQHLLKGCTLASHPGKPLPMWRAQLVGAHRRQHIHTQGEGRHLLRAETVHTELQNYRISLLLETHLLPLPSHGKGFSSQMRSLLRKERSAGNIFQGSRSICPAPKHQRISPLSFQ